MLDILDKSGKVVAVLLDNGQVVKKVNVTDDINKLIKEKLEEERNK